MITKCMLRNGAGMNAEVNLASGGSEFSDSSSSVSIEDFPVTNMLAVVTSGAGRKSRLLPATNNTLFETTEEEAEAAMVTLMEASSDCEDFAGNKQILKKFQNLTYPNGQKS